MNTRVNTIIKNTGFLYVRMFVVMILSLYTSRLVLKILGVEDFGIYSVVGSVTATFASLRSVFSEAIIRFLNYEKGLGNQNNVRQIFSLSLLLHVAVAIIFIIGVEAVGLWLIYNKLNIPPDRFETALFVFHVSVLSSVITIFTVPYDAVIITNEKMNVYALVSMFDAGLKLAVIIFIQYLPFDRLKSYSLLLLLVPLSVLLVYVFYCRRFPECKLTRSFDKKLFKDISVYASWNFAGNFVFSLVHEAYNMLLNMFGSIIENAARSIAYQVKAAVNTFSNNAIIAVKPFIIQESAVNENRVLFNHIILLSKISFYLSLIIAVPIIVYCKELLALWLGEAPEHSVIFTQLVVISILIRSLHGPLSLMYMSVGKIKMMTIVEGLIYILSLVLAWLLLKFGLPSWTVFLLLCIIEAIIIIALSINAKIEINFSLKEYFTALASLSILSISIALISYFVRLFLVPSSNIIMLLFCVVVFILVCGAIYLFMSQGERKMVMQLFNSLKKKYFRN